MKGRIVNPAGQWAARRAFLGLLGLLKTGDVYTVACRGEERLARYHRETVALEYALDMGEARRNGRCKKPILDATGGTIERSTLSVQGTGWRHWSEPRI
jgi:hypothetical protein